MHAESASLRSLRVASLLMEACFKILSLGTISILVPRQLDVVSPATWTRLEAADVVLDLD